ncbi:MAG: hypothetical protein RBS13_05440 [Bacteroidales bacterium]|jgi:hypothetical protein|nr:hypothetical protein [Bacteroidales bacterium]
MKIYHPCGVRKREYNPFGYKYATPMELKSRKKIMNYEKMSDIGYGISDFGFRISDFGCVFSFRKNS